MRARISLARYEHQPLLSPAFWSSADFGFLWQWDLGDSLDADWCSESAVGTIYAIFLLPAVGFGVFGVAVTLYIRSFGISFTGLGMIFGLFNLSASLFGVFFGAHSDLVGRRRYYVLAYVMDTVLRLVSLNVRSKLQKGFIERQQCSSSP